jgi:hypothetical protein
LDQKVKPEHRLKPAEAILQFEKLVTASKSIQNPEAFIKGIFDKIQAWKEKMGDLD